MATIDDIAAAVKQNDGAVGGQARVSDPSSTGVRLVVGSGKWLVPKS